MNLIFDHASRAMLPESPRYLIKRGREESAQKSMARLLSLHPHDPDVEIELNDIRANLRAEEELGSGSYADCFKRGPSQILTRTMTGIFLQAWQQLTGRLIFIFICGVFFRCL